MNFERRNAVQVVMANCISRLFEAIDALFPADGILFQMTVGQNHQNKDELITAEGRWSLHTFLSRPSPWPWLRPQRTRVQGLLRFTSRRCCDGLNGRSRCYNRDVVAVPNFRNI